MGPPKVSSNQYVPSFHSTEDATVVLRGKEHRSGKTLAVAPLTYAGSGEHKEVPQPPKASRCTGSSRLCSYCSLVCTRFLG